MRTLRCSSPISPRDWFSTIGDALFRCLVDMARSRPATTNFKNFTISRSWLSWTYWVSRTTSRRRQSHTTRTQMKTSNLLLVAGGHLRAESAVETQVQPQNGNPRRASKSAGISAGLFCSLQSGLLEKPRNPQNPRKCLFFPVR